MDQKLAELTAALAAAVAQIDAEARQELLGEGGAMTNRAHPAAEFACRGAIRRSGLAESAARDPAFRALLVRELSGSASRLEGIAATRSGRARDEVAALAREVRSVLARPQAGIDQLFLLDQRVSKVMRPTAK